MTASRWIDETSFASEADLSGWCERIGGEGYRGTGTAAHDRVIAWVEAELASLPGFTLASDLFDVLRWKPVPEGDLEHAAWLRAGPEAIPIAGAVPYSAPVTARGPLVHVPVGEPITAEAAAGKVVLRDFPQLPLPYDALLSLALHVTPGMEALREQVWDRPGLADTVIHDDLLAAGAAGAVGMVIAFDLPREQVAGYHEPHKGTHYRVPAVFVGVDERENLLTFAGGEAEVQIAVHAEVERVSTRNLHATLPGQSSERMVIVTHTDGNTWVQENGIAALVALARYFAHAPIEQRRRTLEFAFTSSHLHISREGAARHAARLDEEFDSGDIVLAFPIEHLGARELVPVTRTEGPGRHLGLTGGAEPLLWCAGPSGPLRRAVTDAVTHRSLERTLVLPGFGSPSSEQVPSILSFGGLGTLFNMHLIPTTSIITGPWSLWAPAFGADAIDMAQYRQQALAAGDVIATLDGVPRAEVAGDYLAERAARAAGTPWRTEAVPPEVAPA